MDCIIHRVGEAPSGLHLHQCKVCGRRYESPRFDSEKVHKPDCPGHPVEDTWKPSPARKHDGPNQARRLSNFTLAAIGHVFAGCPTCTQDEADARLAVCRACEMYKPNQGNPGVGRCTHHKCGCEISGVEKFASKLFWRDQDCPLKLWPELPPS